jgi:hypothetical protein
MLVIYKRDEFNGKLKIITEFESFNDLFTAAWYHMDFANVFGYTDVDRGYGGTPFGDHHKSSDWCISVETKFLYVMYDDGKFVTPDRLVGLHRNWKYERRNFHQRSWSRKRDTGQKKTVCGNLRHMKTMHERRWQNAWDDEEFCPPYRPARCGRNLPSCYDDYWVRGQKNWKFQSKRKHQWKE